MTSNKNDGLRPDPRSAATSDGDTPKTEAVNMGSDKTVRRPRLFSKVSKRIRSYISRNEDIKPSSYETPPDTVSGLEPNPVSEKPVSPSGMEGEMANHRRKRNLVLNNCLIGEDFEMKDVPNPPFGGAGGTPLTPKNLLRTVIAALIAAFIIGYAFPEGVRKTTDKFIGQHVTNIIEKIQNAFEDSDDTIPVKQTNNEEAPSAPEENNSQPAKEDQ